MIQCFKYFRCISLYSHFEVLKQCLWIGLIRFSLVKKVSSNSYSIHQKKSQKTNLRRQGAYLKQTIITRKSTGLGRFKRSLKKTHTYLLLYYKLGC